MSATRDQTQKVTFVYSNLYQMYKKGQEAPLGVSREQAKAPVTGKVIKADDLNQQHKVSSFAPAEFIGKRIAKPEVLLRAEDNKALESLKQNLSQLNDLHSRLRFMLKELEDLVKE